MDSNHTSSIVNYLKNTCHAATMPNTNLAIFHMQVPKKCILGGPSRLHLHCEFQTEFQSKPPFFQLRQGITNSVEFNHCANPFVHLENKYNHSEWDSHECVSDWKKSVWLVLLSQLRPGINGIFVSGDNDKTPDGAFIAPTSHWNLILLPCLYELLKSLISEWLKCLYSVSWSLWEMHVAWKHCYSVL